MNNVLPSAPPSMQEKQPRSNSTACSTSPPSRTRTQRLLGTSAYQTAFRAEKHGIRPRYSGDDLFTHIVVQVLEAPTLWKFHHAVQRDEQPRSYGSHVASPLTLVRKPAVPAFRNAQPVYSWIVFGNCKKPPSRGMEHVSSQWRRSDQGYGKAAPRR